MENEKYYGFLLDAHKAHKRGKTWDKLTEEYNNIFEENLSVAALRNRCRRYSKSHNKKEKATAKVKKVQESQEQIRPGEFTQYNNDGVLTVQRILQYEKEVFGDPNKLLEKIGFNPSKWEIISLTTKAWEQGQKNKETKNLYSVGFKIKKIATISNEEVISSLKEIIEENVEPLEFEIPEVKKELDPNLMMEICPIELHMGKLSNANETGENYDIKICKGIFEDLVKRICQIQTEKKCGRALVIIGSDFFNSESDNMTTNKTPQQNDTRYKKLFMTGLELYTKALLTFRELFNEIEVRICSGNHARAMEFFLYTALQQYFRNDDVINFVEDYKDTQAIQFGKCAIFYNHGDANLKRTIASMPAEFYEIWGKTLYRELHLGHLHKEVTVDDESGMITRRIGSPCATDAWHYTNRFIGAIKKHQIFIWNKNEGLEELRYLNVNPSKYDK